MAAMDVRGQAGLSRDVGGVSGGTLNGHIVRGLDDHPDKLLFRQIFLDTVQLARVVMDFDEVDPMRMAAVGGSQGGGLTLACIALEPRIAYAVPVFPFLSGYRRTWEMDLVIDSYDELRMFFRQFDPEHAREDEIFDRLGYIDVQHLASRIESPAADATSGIVVSSPNGADARTLTRGRWFDTDPSWSPDATRLAFTRSPSRTRSDIYLMRADGRGARNLTRGQGLNWGPAWSPNGKQIAFVRFLRFGAQIWLMRPDGSNKRLLTPVGAWNDHPTWSPDNRLIAYSAQRNGRTNLYVTDLRTGKERRLTNDPNIDRSPAWSPDGHRIAFVAQRLDSTVTDIWIVDASGGTAHPLTSSSSADSAPAWSPDGTEIAYVKDEFLGHDHDLYTIPANGGAETPAVTRPWPQNAPSWRPTR